MRRLLFILTAALLLGEFSLPSAFADFVADQFMTVSRGDKDEVHSSKIYTQGKKTRIEMDMAGRRGVNISRGDKKPALFWNIMPEEKMYMEMTGGEGEAFMGKSGKRIEKIFVAKETLAGHPCNKFKLKWEDKEGEDQTGLAWEATDLNDTPIRQEFYHDRERIVVELKNIEIKKLEPDLFEIPAGFKKLSLPPSGPGSPPPAR